LLLPYIMTYNREHFFMGLQAVLYMICATSAFCALIPIGVVKAGFRGHCMLFAEVSVDSRGQLDVSEWGRDSSCAYICWINAILLIMGVFYGSYLLAMCCTGREAFGIEAACCSPFPIQIAVHVAMTFLSFLAACLASSGLRDLCKSIDMNSQGEYRCGEMYDVVWSDPFVHDRNGEFYTFMHTTKTSCWFVFSLVLLNLFGFMARWYFEKLNHAIHEREPIIDSSSSL